jgi:hypothetical protein
MYWGWVGPRNSWLPGVVKVPHHPLRRQHLGQSRVNLYRLGLLGESHKPGEGYRSTLHCWHGVMRARARFW